MRKKMNNSNYEPPSLPFHTDEDRIQKKAQGKNGNLPKKNPKNPNKTCPLYQTESVSDSNYLGWHKNVLAHPTTQPPLLPPTQKQLLNI